MEKETNSSFKVKVQQFYSSKFICPIKYTNNPPEPQLDCKFLPCGKLLSEYVRKPIAFPEKEIIHQHIFKGLHSIFDIDLVLQKIYENTSQLSMSMDRSDVVLLSDVGDIDVTKRNASEHLSVFHKLGQREAVRPEQMVQTKHTTLPNKPMDPISTREQIQMINQTFTDVKCTLKRHPTKPGSTALPVCIMPILPDMELQKLEFVHLQFDIAPVNNSNCLLKDCGNLMVNFNRQENTLKELYLKKYGNALPTTKIFYLSDQRFKEERAAECSENREDRYLFRQHNGKMLYSSCERHIKLRKQRPKAHASGNKMLLQVKELPLCIRPSEEELNEKEDCPQ